MLVTDTINSIQILDTPFDHESVRRVASLERVNTRIESDRAGSHLLFLFGELRPLAVRPLFKWQRFAEIEFVEPCSDQASIIVEFGRQWFMTVNLVEQIAIFSSLVFPVVLGMNDDGLLINLFRAILDIECMVRIALTLAIMTCDKESDDREQVVDEFSSCIWFSLSAAIATGGSIRRAVTENHEFCASLMKDEFENVKSESVESVAIRDIAA